LLRGRCLCGKVSYEIDGEPTVVAHCHCRDCQRLTGSGHSTGAMFPVERIRVRGEPSEFRLVADSGNTVTRSFCGACGSPLFGRNTGMAGVMTVCVGTLDDPGAVTPQVTVFARSRNPWDAFDPGLPSYEAQPSGKPPADP
jgi:hypothetical protein